MITIGIDISSVAAKGYLLNREHPLPGADSYWVEPREAGQTIIEQLLAASG